MRIPKSNVAILTLPSGLRVACRQCRGAAVEYCGAVVGVGSRDDAPNGYGMAHFVEHTIFKGTQRRSSWHIINRMERVGGELNAYTSKEETVVYTAAPSGYLSRSLDLLADLLANSRFPDSEIDKEREVVADEINSYLDTPSEAVYDEFEECIFVSPALGHNILGDIQSLRSFTSDKCQAYLRHWYTAPNMVVLYSGPMAPERVAAMVERHFAQLPAHSPRHPEANAAAKPRAQANPQFAIERNIGSHQAHTVMGALTDGMFSPIRFPMALLCNILGGPGMNSMLNVALREKHGYVYSVEASTSWLTDCGLFTIYFGCDPADNGRCIDLVRGTVESLASKPISPYKLAQAKKQYLGQLAVASDNQESTAISTGRAALYFNNVLTPAETAQRINSITAEQLQEAAQQLTSMSILTLH